MNAPSVADNFSADELKTIESHQLDCKCELCMRFVNTPATHTDTRPCPVCGTTDGNTSICPTCEGESDPAGVSGDGYCYTCGGHGVCPECYYRENGEEL